VAGSLAVRDGGRTERRPVVIDSRSRNARAKFADTSLGLLALDRALLARTASDRIERDRSIRKAAPIPEPVVPIGVAVAGIAAFAFPSASGVVWHDSLH